MSPTFNALAPNASYHVSRAYPPAGTAVDPQPDGKPIPTLFQPITIRGVEFQNRIWLAPMCQYSSEDGVISTWQLAHLGGILTRGPGLSFVEATAVAPEGRITPECAGIWNDEQAAAWAQVVEFAHSKKQKIAMQLAHAGRKASTLPPFISAAAVADEAAGGWPKDTIGPSALPYSDGWPLPKELTEAEIKGVVQAFVDAAKRTIKAGFDVIEIHGAHGFLISSFLSPTSNKRTDEYGGSFENRIRFLVEVVDALRAVMPSTMPLFFRVSATEWIEEALPNEPSWRSEDTVRLAAVLAEHGVDLIDISSSGNHPAQRVQIISSQPGYQVPLAAAVKEALGDKILVAAVGRIHTAPLAESILNKGQADVILAGRMFLKNPSLVWTFAEELGIELHQSVQIGWPFKGRTLAPRFGVGSEPK